LDINQISMYPEELLNSLSKGSIAEDSHAMYNFGFRQGSEKGYANFNSLRLALIEKGYSGEKAEQLLKEFAEGFMDGHNKMTKEES